MEVSRSAYHAYMRNKSYVTSAAKAAIGEQVKDVFYQHRRRYGTRRIAAQLKAEGVRAGRFAVRSQMLRFGLTGDPAAVLSPAARRIRATTYRRVRTYCLAEKMRRRSLAR